jgi:hypothetical protein
VRVRVRTGREPHEVARERGDAAREVIRRVLAGARGEQHLDAGAIAPTVKNPLNVSTFHSHWLFGAACGGMASQFTAPVYATGLSP